MDNTIEKLVEMLKKVLEVKNFDTDKYPNGYLEYEVKQAIETINRCRVFKPTDKKLYDTKYEYLIIPMCVASISKIGAEGETSHSENGVNRTYDTSGDYPSSLLKQIIPLAK